MFAVRQRITVGAWVIGAAVLCAAQSTTSKNAAPVRSAVADRADFELVCGACHNTSMVSDVRTQPEWEETVEHMISIGAKGSPEQIDAVIRVLLRTLTKVNVNTATASQLALPLDIDEVKAQALLAY